MFKALSPLPYVLFLAAVLVALAAMYKIGRIDGTRIAERAALIDKTAALTRLIAEQAALAEQDREILSADVARRDRIVTQFQIIDREVNRYALLNRDAAPCLDSDGLRVWRAAARADAAEIAAAAPGGAERVSAHPAGAGNGTGAGPAEQLHGGGEAVSHAAGAVSKPGRMGNEPGNEPGQEPQQNQGAH